MTATLRDVARAAGVSVATASRALAHPDMLRAETVARVQACAQQLDYAPNAAAVALTTGRNTLLGLVLRSLTNPMFARLATAIQRHALEEDLGLRIVDVAGTGEDEEAALLERLSHQETGGIIAVAPQVDDLTLARLSARTPLVLVNRQSERIPAVILDVPTGIARAIDHLADLGHTRIAYVSGPIRAWSDERRRRRVRERVRLYGMRMDYIGPSPPVFRSGVAAAEQVMRTGATAIVAYNSLIALGVMYRLAEAGIRVPEDISVVSGDDMETLGLTCPAVTALHLPIEDAAHTAVRLMRAVIAGAPAQPKPVTIPVTLIPRESTGQVANGARAVQT